MKHLFEDRERLFALQRNLDQPDLQKRAEEAVHTYETGAGTRRRNEVRRWRRFCTAANIPPWPVTNSLRALCIVAKFSGGSYGYKRLWSVLTTLANLTGAVFKSAPAYLELASLKAPPWAAFKTKVSSSLTPTPNEISSGESGSDDEEATTTPMTSLLPNPSQQSFATVNDALVACAIPLIKTYGYPARIERECRTNAYIYCNRHNSYYSPNKCSYHWAVTLDEQKQAWVIDSASSELSHNHGINPELAKDPTWRPRLHNLVVKEALKLADAPSTRAIGKRTSRAVYGAESWQDAEGQGGKSDEDGRGTTEVVAKRLKTNKLLPMRPPPVIMPAQGGPRLKPDLQVAIERVAAFFAAAKEDLHLVPLAAAFVEEGLQTVEDLTKFTCLDPAIRNDFIGAVQKKFDARHAPTFSDTLLS